MFRSLKTRILISYICMVLIIVGSLGIASYFLMVRHLKDKQQGKLENSALHSRVMINDNFKDIKITMQRISGSYEVEEYIERDKDIPLKMLFASYRNYFPLMKFINEKGAEEIKLIRGDISGDLRDTSKSPLFKDALRNPGKVIFSPAKKDTDLKELVVYASIAKKSYFDDEFKGVLAGAIPVSHITRQLSTMKIGKTGFAMLIDTQGKILFHPQKDNFFGKIEDLGEEAEELIANATSMKSGFTRATILGIDAYTAYVPLKDMGWSLILSIPYEEFIAAPNILRNTAIATLFITLVIGVIIAFQLSRGITVPLLDLAAFARRVAKGDFSHKMDIHTKDEIYTVVMAFNKMIEDLERTTVSKDYVDNILHSMNDTLIVIDPEGVIKRVNKAALELLGYTEEELTGLPIEKIFPEDSPFAGAEVDYLIKKDVINADEIIYMAKDGNKIPVTFSSSVMRDNNGDIQGIVCVAQDITERRWIEEALRTSEEYFRAFVESSQDCMCNISVDGKFMSMNPAGCTLNDIKSQEEIIGTSCTANITENREAIEEAIRQAAKGEKVSVQYKSMSNKGREIWWDSKFTPVVDIDGSVKSILQVSRDITKQKIMEESLLNAQEMLIREHNELSSLFKKVEKGKKEWENTMDCVGDIVMLTDKEGKIRRFNKALLKFANKSFEEILGKNWEELMSENELETVAFYAGSIELLHKPTQRKFELNSYPFEDVDLEFSGAVITMHETTEIKNITDKLEKAYKELKTTQAQILQREKMASIGQLAAGVAHEINNPMGFISSNLGTLGKYVNKLSEFINTQTSVIESLKSSEISEELTEKRKKLKLDYILKDVQELINESLEGAERVKKIVQNLKTFSRVDEAEYKYADINECIESTLNIVWNELKYKAAVEKDYQKLPLTKCYPQQLNQVFMNLLVNAAHSIEKQGEIKIKTWNGNGFINVSISDTGCGIPADKINRIFEPFFTTKEVGKGTGLGLSISYDIVKKHNGEINIDSEIGKGTVFTVKIPVMEGK
ncbi:sporulation kinase E [bacterium BMS3Abin06]|nr:sporulation kinase E [bacterium BMS3Abin06]